MAPLCKSVLTLPVDRVLWYSICSKRTHTLTFSGYLGRQVVLPFPVAKQLPSPLPPQRTSVACLFPSVSEGAFIKAVMAERNASLRAFPLDHAVTFASQLLQIQVICSIYYV